MNFVIPLLGMHMWLSPVHAGSDFGVKTTMQIAQNIWLKARTERSVAFNVTGLTDFTVTTGKPTLHVWAETDF